MMKREEIW